MQRCLDTFRIRPLRRQRAIGEEAWAIERNRAFEAGRRIILDELDRSAAREKCEHRVRFLLRDLRDECLEFDLREWKIQLLDHLTAELQKTLLHGLDVFLAGSVAPGDGHDVAMAGVVHHLAHREAWLPVGEGCAPEVWRTHPTHQQPWGRRSQRRK